MGGDRVCRGNWGRRILPAFLLLILVGAPAGLAEDEAPAWSPSQSGLEVTGIDSLVMHPKRQDLLYAHVHGVGVARSFDGGKTWEVLHKGIDPSHLPTPRDPVEIAIDPREEQNLWLVTKGHVYKSEDGGENWQDVTTGALVSYSWDKRDSGYHIRGVVVDPSKSLHVLAGSRTEGRMRGGLYETMDGGKTWEQIAGTDLPKSELGHDAWPIVLDPRTDKNLAVGGSNGVWYSDDRGREFKRVDPGELGEHAVRDMTSLMGRSRDLYLADARGLWRSPNGGRRWDKKPLVEGDCLAIGRAPWSRNLLLANFREKGLMRSEDGGRSWTEIGMPEANIRQIFAHPRDKDVVFFASPTTGLWISKDEGATLEQVPMEAEPVVPSIIAVAAHPATPGHMLALGEYGQVYHSEDDALTWTAAGRVTNEATSLIADSRAGGAWFAAGRTLEYSEDHGATWKSFWQPEETDERPIAFHLLQDGAMGFVLERSRRVVRSPDGKSWAIVKAPGKSSEVWAADLALDPSSPKHLLMASTGRAHLWTPKEEEGGPYESWDGGNSWEQLTEGLAVDKKQMQRNWNRGRMTAIDPEAGLVFYAADRLGLFARRIVGPDDKPDVEPRWIDLGLPLPQPELHVGVVLPSRDQAPGAIVMQITGENDARALVRTTMPQVLERIAAVEAGEKTETSLWETLPDPGSILSCLSGDPHVAGRILAGAHGIGGVLVLGTPGQAVPADDEGEKKDSAQVPPDEAPKPEAAPSVPTGLLALTGSGAGAVRVWNVAERKEEGALAGAPGEVLCVAASPDGTRVATGGTDRIPRLYDVATGEPIPDAPGEPLTGAINALAFVPSGGRLVLGLEESWAVTVLDLEGNSSRDLVGHTGGVLALDVSADGAQVASGGRDRTVRLWDVATGEGRGRGDFGSEVFALAYSPDGARLYVGGRGGAVKVFDVQAGTFMASAEVQGEYVTGLAVSPDGETLYVAGDRGLRAVASGDLTPAAQPQRGVFEGPSGGLLALAISQDGEWLLGGDREGTLWLWSRDGAKPVWSARAAPAGSVGAVAFGRRAAAAGGEAGDGS